MDAITLHRSIVVVDVEGYGDLARSTHHRLAARAGMYRVMRAAFTAAGLPWDDLTVDDAGDSLLLVLPADVRKLSLVDILPGRVAAELRRHNEVHAHGARLRMRMAVHAGEIHYDDHGKTSPELIFACRILDAPEAKLALKDSTAPLVLIVSEAVYESVVRQDPAAAPAEYRRITAEVKETRAHAWIRLIDGRPNGTPNRGANGTARPQPTERRTLPLDTLRPFVDILLETPGFDARDTRDLLLGDLPFSSVIARQHTDRADAVSIVRTCWRYPGGPEALLDAVRFYAEGSAAMDKLQDLLAAWRAGASDG